MTLKDLNKKLKYRLSFSIGDPSDDGHGRYKDYLINCNYSNEEIEKIYEKVKAKLGFDFIEKAASEYESRELAPEYTKRLIDIGFLDKDNQGIVPEDDTWDTPGSYYFETTEEFVGMFFDLLQFIQPDLDYEFVTLEYGDTLRLLEGAGYGLFG